MNYLRDFVYGSVDGIVTTFAVVAGVAGAGLRVGVIVVIGVANLLADGFSMAAGNFLASRAENQQLVGRRRRMRRRGQRGSAEPVGDAQREAADLEVRRDPIRAAVTTFAAFVGVGVLPLVPFLLGHVAGLAVPAPFVWSAVLAAAGFVLIGAVKSRVVDESLARGAAVTVAVGGAAAAVAYIAGRMLGPLG